MKQLQLSYTAGGNAKARATLENSLVLSSKAKHTLILPYDSEIVLVGINPREIKSYVHTKM